MNTTNSRMLEAVSTEELIQELLRRGASAFNGSPQAPIRLSHECLMLLIDGFSVQEGLPELRRW